ncbi:MAG: precorrin-2 C(20)-methyltransferase, partial [Leptolyngbya sp. ERB_1_2]
DPFFYGSFMYLYNRLSDQFQTEVIPGVSCVMASPAILGTPLTYRNDVFMVLSAILPAEQLADRLSVADAAAIIKLGKHFNKVVGVQKQLGLYDRAKYIERATMPDQQIVPISEIDPTKVPYFSMIVIPSQWQP